MINYERMEDQLFLEEGFRSHPYEDTLENLTVGVGYNLSARGVDDINRLCGTAFTDIHSVVLTEAQARTVLQADIKRCEAAITEYWSVFSQLTEVRQRVIVDLVFNMGFAARTFVRAKAAAEKGDWSQFVRELYNSKWATQVGYNRAHRLGTMALTNQDWTS